MPPILTSRKDAISAGHTRYFTGKPCLRGHIDEKHTSSAMCITCANEKARNRVKSPEEIERNRLAKLKYERDHPEKVHAAKLKYAKSNRDKISEKAKAKYAKAGDVARKHRRETYASDITAQRIRSAAYREKNKDACNARIKDWGMRNKDKTRSSVSRRRAARLIRTTSWDTELTKLVEVEAHDKCVRMETITGSKWHLDHIIPLRGRRVSGLHVWNNFQVLPGAENRRKLNKYEVA